MFLPLAFAFLLADTRYPLSPNDLCGAAKTCQQVIDAWNDATWNDVVDDDIQSSGTSLAAVRWYSTEGECTGTKCENQLRVIADDKPNDVETHRFGGVTDEFGNVLLSHAMGSDQTRYHKLRNFSELLRVPEINNLQCWKYHVNGKQAYTQPSQLCYLNDSASDASIRILGAYGIACAKQRAGIWATTGFANYCDDYERQGNAIFGRGTTLHGEVKRLANGEAFLANGFNNQPGAPTNWQAFRPDYYELQFLMDFALQEDDASLRQDVIDMLNDYLVSAGANLIHRGKTGFFNSDTTMFTCGELCSPPYMDNIDTWRAVPALSGLRVAHPALVPAPARMALFDEWWMRYAGGNSSYPAVGAKPFEINADATPAVRQTDLRYKVYGMWIPLGVGYDAVWTRDAIRQLVDVEYHWDQNQFDTAAYYGAYYSQFAQRAIGSATGLLDPSSYGLSAPANVIATATGPNAVTVSWAPVAGADFYEVARSDGGSFLTIATRTETNHTDTTVTGGATYLYKVRAVDGVTPSAYSPPDHATTLFFTDEPLTPGVTPIRAQHIDELRTAVNAVREAADLPAFSFTDSSIGAGTSVRAVHMSELRTALAEAFETLGTGAIGYADPVISSAITRIRAVHVQQLRMAVK